MHLKTSAPIGAWKCNFPAHCKEIMTDDNQSDRPTNQPTDGHEVSQESYTSKKLYLIILCRMPKMPAV